MPFVYLFVGDPLNSVLGRLEASLVSKGDLGQPGYTEKLSQHPSCMFMHNTRDWCLWRSEGEFGSFWTWSYELL